MNGHTARQKANAVEDWCREHVLRRGTGEALADIEDVSYDKNGKDSGLNSDQNEHSDAPARGQFPRERLLQWDVCRVHSYFQSGSAGCLRSQSGRRLLMVGMTAKLYAGGGEGVDHSRVQASHGSLPAVSPLKYDHTRFATKTTIPNALKKTPMVTMRFHTSHPRPGS